MSDLSNLLGDVYGDHSSPDGPPVRHEPPASQRAYEIAPAYEIATPAHEVSAPAPAWSSESQLDRAFSGWVPGEAPRPDDDLAAALSAALRSPVAAPQPPTPAPVAAPTLAESLVELAPAPRAAWTAPINLTASTTPEPVMAMAAAPAQAWVPGDDDIFPMGRKGKRKK